MTFPVILGPEHIETITNHCLQAQKDIFLINGSVNNSQSSLDNNLLKLLNLNFKNLNIEDVKFKSKNNFTLEINNKLRV